MRRDAIIQSGQKRSSTYGFFFFLNRNQPRAIGKTLEAELGQRLFQLADHEINFVGVSFAARLCAAGFQLCARFKRYVADVNRAAVIQKRKQRTNEACLCCIG